MCWIYHLSLIIVSLSLTECNASASRLLQRAAMPLGINWEGTKITEWALEQGAEFALNIQISMDAPFANPPEEANEIFRSIGPSEVRMKDFNPVRYVLGLKRAFKAAALSCQMYNIPFLVIQIARGRAMKWMQQWIDDLFQFELNEDFRGIGYEFVRGYNESTWVIPQKAMDAQRFGFMNIGMFARISEMPPGVVMECRSCIAAKINPQTKQLVVDRRVLPKLGQLHPQTGLDRVLLIALADGLPFVESPYTKTIYRKDKLEQLVYQKPMRSGSRLL